MLRIVFVFLLLIPGAAQRAPFEAFRPIARLPKVELLAEISGIVASRENLGCYWVHGDKGDRAFLTAIDLKGRVVQRFHVKGAKSKDWEDIAYGPGPRMGRGCLYIGDFGNNNKKRKKLALLRIAEPVIGLPDQGVRSLRGVDRFRFRYPDGKTHDAETLLIDPVDGSPYILTKEEGATAYLYRYPLPLEIKGTKTLLLAMRFMHVRPKFSGGDVSADGSSVVVRNRRSVFFYSRPQGTPFAAAFTGRAMGLSGSRQGNAEAIAFRADGSGLVAVSEADEALVWASRAVVCLQPSMQWRLSGGGVGLGSGSRPRIGLHRAPVLAGPATDLGLWAARPGDVAWIAFEARGQLPGLETALLRIAVGAKGRGRTQLGGLPTERSLYGAQWALRAVTLGGVSRRVAVRSARAQ